MVMGCGASTAVVVVEPAATEENLTQDVAPPSLPPPEPITVAAPASKSDTVPADTAFDDKCKVDVPDTEDAPDASDAPGVPEEIKEEITGNSAAATEDETFVP